MLDLTYWLLAIVLFGMVILLHELGHFWAARLTGVRVMEFAVGFGPKLFARRAKSGVTYSVRALPLGGYCRFVADDEEGVPEEDAYYRTKIWKRVTIALAGPVMNYITAIVLVFLLFFAIGLPVIPVVRSLIPGLPAETAGMLLGDRITEIGGQQVYHADVTAAIAEATAGDPEGYPEIVFTVERAGQSLTIPVRPQWVEAQNRAMIGIEYGAAPKRFSLGVSLESTFAQTFDMTKLIFRTLRDLIFKGEGADQLSGPIGTVTMIKQQTEAGGVFNYLNLAAIISVNLALFNLLPVPGLDGSKLIFLAIEKIRGKRLDPHKEGTVLLIGFALMVGLTVMVMFNDIVRLFK